MVQPNGIGELPGTLFKADRQCTSWKVTPANSGVRTVRTSPASRPMPGRAEGSSTDSERPSHLMTPSEHMFVPFARKRAGTPPGPPGDGCTTQYTPLIYVPIY